VAGRKTHQRDKLGCGAAYIIVNDDVSRAAAALVDLMGLTPHHIV
jgi:hypothetical protein